MSEFNVGDRVYYTGTLTPELVGSSGTVKGGRYTGGVLVNWDDASITYNGDVLPSNLKRVADYKAMSVLCKDEAVKHPAHYGGAANPYEAIKVIKAWELGFSLGNVVKYVARAGKKVKAKEIEDLKKARFYLDDRIKELEAV